MTDKPETTAKTATGLQDVLWEQVERMRTGETTPATVNAIVNATSAILRIVKLQMTYAEKTGKTPNIPLLLTEAAPE